MFCIWITLSILVSAGILTAEAPNPEPRLVWSGPEVTLLGAPSLDGRYISYVDSATGNLAVRENATGLSRKLTALPAGSRQFAYFSTISRDSRRVAFAWFNEAGFYDLRVVAMDGSNERVLYRNEEAGFVQPCAWSADGKQILTLFFRSDNISQIALVPADGGPPRILRSLNWVYPKRMDLSPDGRFVVYDSFAGAAGGDRTIFSLSTKGDQETRLVTAPGNHLFPLWTPDGSHVVFASERDGKMGAWIVPVANGKAKADPQLLRPEIGRALPLSIAQNGDYYFGVRSGETDVFVTTLSNPSAKPLRATIRFPGRNTAPAWSADGRLLAFLSRSGTENFGESARSIVVRSVEPDEERQLTPKLAHMERVRWSPDSRSLLVSGSDGKGRGGLFLVDAATSKVTSVVARPGASFRGFPACWSKDGETIYYIDDESELRSHAVESGKESAIYRGRSLRQIALSPDGQSLALSSAGSAILLLPVAGGDPRSLAFDGLTELEWGHDLIAARGVDLFRVPLDGETPQRIEMPGNRGAGFSLHPDNKRVALTAGATRSEVWALSLKGLQE
jgi:Tol biopolymer transport system component